jgi:hypothetical protein
MRSSAPAEENAQHPDKTKGRQQRAAPLHLGCESLQTRQGRRLITTSDATGAIDASDDTAANPIPNKPGGSSPSNGANDASHTNGPGR